MIPVLQTRFGSPHGNCLGAAVSSITGIPIGEFDECEGKRWFEIFYGVLYRHGYEFHGTLDKLEDILSYSEGVDGFYIVGGGSPRSIPAGHAVVFKNGEMVHDPHPDGTGIVSIDYAYMIEKIAELPKSI